MELVSLIGFHPGSCADPDSSYNLNWSLQIFRYLSDSTTRLHFLFSLPNFGSRILYYGPSQNVFKLNFTLTNNEKSENSESINSKRLIIP